MNKILSALLVTLLSTFLIAHTQQVHADLQSAPAVEGNVTGADGVTLISNHNIWLDWQVLNDNNQRPDRHNIGGRRFARTSNGWYKFDHYNAVGPGTQSIWDKADEGSYNSSDLNDLLSRARAMDGSIKRMRYSHGGKNWTQFGCHQNNHKLSVVIPSGRETQGKFVVDGADTRQTYQVVDSGTAYSFDMPNGSGTLKFNFKWEPGDTSAPTCPTLQVNCSNTTDAAGNVRADLSWGGNTTAAQFIGRVHNSVLAWNGDTIDYFTSASSPLSATTRNLMFDTRNTGMQVYIAPNTDYYWSIVPGLGDWPLPSDAKLWQTERGAPLCMGPVIRCESGSTNGTASIDVNSCRQTASQQNTSTYVHDLLVQADRDFADAFQQGQLMLKFSIPQSNSQLISLVEDFFAGAITSQATAGGTNLYQISLWNINRTNFQQVGTSYRLVSSLPSAHAFSNGRTVAEFDQLLTDASITDINEFADIVFVDTTSGSPVEVDAGWINLACTNAPPPPPTSCTEVQPQITLSTEPLLYNPQNSTVTVQWQLQEAIAGGVTAFDVYMFDTDMNITAVENATADTGRMHRVRVPRAPGQTSFTQTMNLKSTMSSNVTVAVRAIVDETVPATGICEWVEEPKPVSRTISGNFYYFDPSWNSCPTNPTEEIVPSGGVLVSLRETGKEGRIEGSTYTIDAPPNQLVHVELDLTDTNYFCPQPAAAASCPSTNAVRKVCTVRVQPGDTLADFFIQSESIHTSWWQVKGGLVYGENRVTNPLPLAPDGEENEQCATTASCTLVVLDRLANQLRSIGVLIGGGISDVVQNWVSERGLFASGSVFNSATQNQNYEYFSKLVSLPAHNLGNDATITSIPAGESREVDGETVNIVRSRGNVTIGLPNADSDPITINNNEKHIIFVEGNLTVSAPQQDTPVLRVQNGGFIAFIATGDIIFQSTVGTTSRTENPDVSDSLVDGIFIADGSLTTSTNNSGIGDDLKFIGSGSFIGWDNVILARRYEDGGLPEDDKVNNIAPMEVFLHRPDFVVNAPKILSNTSLTWREVN